MSLAPHLIVEALAGTGKTTTLIEGLKKLKGLEVSIDPSPQQEAVWDALTEEDAKRVNFVAFNKLIAEELKTRVPAGYEAMTMHSMGLRIVRNTWTLQKKYGGVNGYRCQSLIEELTGKDIWDLKKKAPVFLDGTEKLVGLCKVNVLEPTTENLLRLAAHYDVDTNGEQSRIFDMVPQVLERALDVAKDGCVDFNDMIWIPVALDLPANPWDLLLWDECQDGNRCQQALAMKCGNRLLLCGDRHQAIYGFAGSDTESMNNMEETLANSDRGVVKLPLTVTRRCGKAVVKLAKELVPAFEAHESNSDGAVTHDSCDKYRYLAKPGDMILCRTNAPLVSECFWFLRNGVKANIQGRDVGTNMVSTIKRVYKNLAQREGIKGKGWDKFFGTLKTEDFIQRLSAWETNEVKKLRGWKNCSDLQIANIHDRVDCLSFFCEDQDNLGDVVADIKKIFTDKSTNGVLLSSIHKSKGLEADNVFLIEPGSATVPHPMAKQAWEVEQEWNLRYVAITRAKHNLYLITDGETNG